jgi:isochorismate synthase
MDLDKLLLRIERARIENAPFVLYRKPNAKKIYGLFQKNKDLHYLKSYSESGFVFSPFNDKEKTVIFPLEESELIGIDAPDVSSINKNTSKERYNGTENKKEHIQLVEKGIDFLEQNNVDKVVLSRKEEIVLNYIDLKSVFKNLLSNYPTAFIYIWSHSEVGTWIGASPETLIQVKENKFRTMALAATKSYSGKLDLNWSKKEKQEQQFVVDFIISQLKEFNLNVSKSYSKRAGSLVHICTDISGDFTGNRDLGDLINKLHPTPAVCGLPRKEAKNFILKNENYDREYYTGFFGELNYHDQSDLFVNLRCMQIIPARSIDGYVKAILYIGGGITTHSDAEKEWEETVAKSKVIKRVLF